MIPKKLFASKKYVLWIIFAGILGFVSILLFERVLLWFSPQVGSFYQYDPDLGFTVQPYANGSNAFGFNDRDYPLQKQVGHFRIVVLGDSFSWAGGKDKNYTALLEKRFEKYYGQHRVDVINAGYSMTHTGEQLALLKKYAIQYNPDLVLLGFFCGNDIFDADPYRKRIVVGGVFVDVDSRLEFSLFGSPAPPGVIFLNALKKIFVRAAELFHRLKERQDETAPKVCEPASIASCSPEKAAPGTRSRTAFLGIEKARLSVFDTRKHATGEFDRNIQYVFRKISEMKTFLQAQDSELIVALYPDEFQVNEVVYQDILKAYDLDEQHYDLRLVQNLVTDYLRSHKIPDIDLLDEFRSHHKKGSLYLLRDTHWNEAGNVLAADILFSALLPQVKAYFNTGPIPGQS